MIGERLSSDEWLTYLRTYEWGQLRPTRLVLHHTYRPTSKQWQGLRSMRRHAALLCHQRLERRTACA